MSRPRLPVFCLGLFVLKPLQVFCTVYHLGMFEGSFDDQYIGCTDEMDSIAPELLSKIRKMMPEFDVLWRLSTDLWEKEKHLLGRLPEGFKDEYGIAFVMLTFKESFFGDLLNEDIKRYSKSPKSFRFHAFHFYFTRALNLLQPGCDGNLLYVHRSDAEIQLKPPSDPQAPVRLDSYIDTFTDFGLEENKIMSLSVITCFGIILNFTRPPWNYKGIVPINEVFRVINYNKAKKNILLQSTYKKCSYYNCAYLGGTKNQTCIYYSSSGPTIMKFREAATAPLLVTMSIALIFTTWFLIG